MDNFSQSSPSTNDPSHKPDPDAGGRIAIGLALGAVVGGLVGHFAFGQASVFAAFGLFFGFLGGALLDRSRR